MATYEYVCLACEGHFEQRRPMGSEFMGGYASIVGEPPVVSDRPSRWSYPGRDPQR